MTYHFTMYDLPVEELRLVSESVNLSVRDLHLPVLKAAECLVNSEWDHLLEQVCQNRHKKSISLKGSTLCNELLSIYIVLAFKNE